jgi:hypothetical protein
MFLLIKDDKIIGTTNDKNLGLPKGYKFFEVEDIETPTNFYVDGSEVKRKPPKPGDSHYWDETNKTWAEVKMPSPMPEPQKSEVSS